jgi:hypothetical protein
VSEGVVHFWIAARNGQDALVSRGGLERGMIFENILHWRPYLEHHAPGPQTFLMYQVG